MKSFITWKNKVLTGSYKVDLDNGSLDCVDVPKDWGQYLFDLPWQTCCGWGNAKDLYANWPTKYWDKLPRGNRAKLGDVVVMNGSIGGGYGHTGVVVAIDGNSIQIAQQNTFTQVPVYTGWYDMNASYITGFMRPKIEFATSAASEPLLGYQRKVGADAVYYRKAASRDGEKIELFDPGEVVNFKGFVKGETVEGNNIWFVGRFTGGYSWSGGYTDKGTHDLADLTPSSVVIAKNQRQVGNDVMNYRKEPVIAPENVIRTFNPGEVLTFDGWIRGQAVDGNDVWFRGAITGGYMWSGGLADSSTHDLPEIKATPTPNPVPTDPPTTPTTPDTRITVVVNKKHPNVPIDYAPTDLVSVGNGQYLRSEPAAQLAKMQAAAGSGVLVPSSGYRSFAVQTTVYNGYVAKDGQAKADTYSARPGYSEHQTGLAMDFGSIDDSFANTGAYKWLTDNAHKYGFVLRYPAGKTPITGYVTESWHWRYIGITAATDMKNKGITTLEEYYNVTGGLYAGQDPVTPPTTDPGTPDPTPQPTPPTEEQKDATVEAMKVVGRNGILAAVSAVITAFGNWALSQLAGVNLPQELLISIGGLVYAGLLALDKWIHDNAKTRLKGLIGF